MEYGECRYCGQTTTSLPAHLTTREQADEWATRNCSCAQSRRMQQEEQRIFDAVGRVRELFGEDCDRYGFRSLEQEYEEEILSALSALATLAAKGVIRAAAVQIIGEGKASITLDSKGNVRIGRSITRACQLEA